MKRWCLLLLFMVLQGCSTLQLGYNQLPTLGYWWLDSQLSLDSAQSERTREALQQLQRWHRQKELPLYADLLRKLQDTGTGDLDAPQVCSLWSQVQDRMDVLMRETVRQAMPVATQLAARQLRHLSRHWDSKNEEWEKEWLAGDPQERLRRRVERAVSRYTDFYGALQDSQIALIRTQLQQSLWTPEWGRQDRLRRQQDLLAALQRLQQGGLSASQAEATLLQVWQHWLNPPQAQDQALYRAFTEQTCQHLAQLHNSTTPAQRQRAVRRLRAYETDLRELARQ